MKSSHHTTGIGHGQHISPLIARIVPAFAIIVAFAFFSTGTTASAATTTVTVANGDTASLANAINAFNAGTTDYVINLATGGNYFVAGSGLPAVADPNGNRSFTINGNGATIQRSVATAFAIFENDSSTVTINSLSIEFGSSVHGGGLYANTTRETCPFGFCVPVGGSTVLSRCTFFHNSGLGAIGVALASSVTLDRCSLVQNTSSDGGAISNYGGSVSATNCTFANNAGAFGGGVCNRPFDGTVALTNCTFYANTASSQGGAVFNSGQDVNSGGPTGVVNGFATVTITNCTLASNSATSAGSAIYNHYASNVPGSSCTCHGSVTITNTIISGAADTGSAIVNDAGQFTSSGHNLCDDAAGGDNTTAPGGLLNATGDLRNTNAQLVATLADNGGPVQTVALQSTSPAINAGDDSHAPKRDERGYVRSGSSDIGAYDFDGVVARIDSISSNIGGDFIVTAEVTQGFTYHLQRNFDLTNPNNWVNSPQSVALTPTGDDAEQLIDLSAEHFFPFAFYRITRD